MKYASSTRFPAWAFIFTALFCLQATAVDEDSGTLFELGILNWLHYQKIKLSDHVYEVRIKDSAFEPGQLDIALPRRGIHGKLIFENGDETTHRIIFEQHIGNDLPYEISSPVMQTGERWAVDILKDGIYPFRCTLHPGMQGMMQVWYEQEDFW